MLKLSLDISKLVGIIFVKAEIENDFEKVYLNAMRKIFEIEFVGEFDEIDFLQIFGEIGG